MVWEVWKVSGRAPVGKGSCANRENTEVGLSGGSEAVLEKPGSSREYWLRTDNLVNARCLLPLGTELSLALSFSFYAKMTLFTPLQ